MKAVAPPMMARSHIQKTAPGPPTVMAMATPATLPVPTRDAAEMVKARKAEMPFLSGSMSEGFSVMVRSISGKSRIWTINVVTEKYSPAITRSAMTPYQ